MPAMMFQFIFHSPVTDDIMSSGSSWRQIIFGALVAAGVLLVLIFLWQRVRRTRENGMDRKKTEETWKGILTTSEHGSLGAKLAVIEADKLLDHALKSLFVPGETLGERLKSACYKYPKLRDVWWAHKLRNHLVHEAGSDLSSSQARSALREYEKALKLIGAL